jgi:hypothetical protein
VNHPQQHSNQTTNINQPRSAPKQRNQQQQKQNREHHHLQANEERIESRWGQPGFMAQKPKLPQQQQRQKQKAANPRLSQYLPERASNSDAQLGTL